MTIQRTRFWFSALLLSSASSFTSVGNAQSLALAYDLAVGIRSSPMASRSSPSCDSQYEVSRLLECGVKLPEDTRWMPRGKVDEQRGADARSNAETPGVNTAPSDPDTRFRFAADANGSSSSEDVPIRLGLKYRIRRDLGSYEPYGLTDPRFEAWSQRKELNLVGVEVLFRFR